MGEEGKVNEVLEMVKDRERDKPVDRVREREDGTGLRHSLLQHSH